MADDTFQVLAIRYATVERLRKDNFLLPVDGAPGQTMQLDFFVWLVVGHGTVLLVDTGFSAIQAVVRSRQYLTPPVDALAALGYPVAAITDVAITHLHYDHAGNIGEFPAAKVWIQDSEVRYATGRCMCDARQSHFFAPADIGCLVRRLHEGHVQLIDGRHVLRDGIEFYRVGGHTDGLQVVRVRTAQGWVVLASDAAHYYENLATANPFPAIFSLDDMLTGYALIRGLADGDANIVPGHDPAVCQRYPAVDAPGVQAFRIA